MGPVFNRRLVFPSNFHVWFELFTMSGGQACLAERSKHRTQSPWFFFCNKAHGQVLLLAVFAAVAYIRFRHLPTWENTDSWSHLGTCVPASVTHINTWCAFARAQHKDLRALTFHVSMFMCVCVLVSWETELFHNCNRFPYVCHTIPSVTIYIYTHMSTHASCSIYM